MTVTNKRYSYLRVMVIRIDVHHVGINLINTSHAFHARSMYGLQPCISHGPRRQHFASPHEDETGPYTRKKSWRPKIDWSRPWVTSFVLPHDRLGVGERGFSQMVTQLHHLIGHIYQDAIGMFNTCSWGPIHRSLTDISGGYNIEGADFLHITPRPCQPMVIRFPPKVPARSPI
jgi:hypothetical protein